MRFLTTEPLWLSGILLIGVATLLTMAGPVVIRRRIGLDRLAINNEVAGFKFATVGVLYAVLLAFVVIVVWEKFNDAEIEVSQEAGATATIFRLSEGLSAGPAAALRDSLTRYAEAVIANDWPAMERGGSSSVARQALDGVYATLLTYHPDDRTGAALLTEILHQLDLVTQGRRARLVMATGVVPGIVWLVLFSGAALTIGFTFFFGAENLRAQVIMAAALSVLIFSELLIIIAIDHPFAGTVKVEPDAMKTVVEDFGATSPR